MFLGNAGLVDFDMDDRGVRRPAVHHAGHAVIETGPDGDDEVGVLHCLVGPPHAVHAQHSQRQRVVFRKRAQPVQAGGYRNIHVVRELRQHLPRRWN